MKRFGGRQFRFDSFTLQYVLMKVNLIVFCFLQLTTYKLKKASQKLIDFYRMGDEKKNIG